MASWDKQFEYRYAIADRLEAGCRAAKQRADSLGDAAALIRTQASEIERLHSKLQATKLKLIRSVPATPALDEAADLMYDGHDIGRGRLTHALAARAIIEADRVMKFLRTEAMRR